MLTIVRGLTIVNLTPLVSHTSSYSGTDYMPLKWDRTLGFLADRIRWRHGIPRQAQESHIHSVLLGALGREGRAAAPACEALKFSEDGYCSFQL